MAPGGGVTCQFIRYGLVEHAAAILPPNLLLVDFMIVALVDLEFEE